MDCMSLPAMPVKVGSYYENRIVLEWRDGGIGTRGSYERWDAYLRGEYVGEIEFFEKPHNSWDKPYSASTVESRYTSHVGSYDTMVAAKRALHEAVVKRGIVEERREKERATPVAFLPETDCQFYPTPSDVAGKLMAGVDWKIVKSVLEPSAGRGDLIEWAKKRCKKVRYPRGASCWGRNTYSIDLDDIDCVEIDPNLQALLVGKGYRVVHDDFLTYHTRKRYDLILVNPPFAEGDKHLLHALELCENGGQIACILNAETILNPFTNSRKALLKILRKYDASIRYVERGFSRAARRADVDVALINVNIPATNEDTTIWDNLKRAREEHLETNGLHEVAPANQVERLIREYDLLCSAGIQMMRVYNGVSDRIMRSSKSDYNSPIIGLIVDGDKTDKCGTGHINTFLRAARARYWRELFDLPELRQKMTSAMQDEYHSTIERMKDYEFSQFNIQQVVNQIMGQIVTGVEEAIVKCFDKLSAEHSYHSDVQNENIHYYNGWKTNKAHYVNSKCIIPTCGCFARGYKPDKYGRYKDTLEGLDARGCFQVLDDLEKALDYLDKGETPASDLSTKLQHAANSGRTTVSCKYFMVTFYKKGTCHIKFNDQKIVDRLNIYVGRQRAWLPPTYGSVRYDQMDEESKRIVDEFQGREKYEAVINCPNDYIIETKAAPLLLM